MAMASPTRPDKFATAPNLDSFMAKWGSKTSTISSTSRNGSYIPSRKSRNQPATIRSQGSVADKESASSNARSSMSQASSIAEEALFQEPKCIFGPGAVADAQPSPISASEKMSAITSAPKADYLNKDMPSRVAEFQRLLTEIGQSSKTLITAAKVSVQSLHISLFLHERQTFIMSNFAH